jgi:ParB family chromosome partitioning protein
VSRRSGLGKGLGALIPTEAVVSETNARFQEVPISSIRPNPHQPRSRFDEESLSSLAASIKEIGILQPLLVRKIGNDEYELIAGERRWRAARRAGLQRVPVITESIDDATSLRHAIVENLHREDLNPLEEAAAYQQLIEEFGLTHEEVAHQIGKSRAAVSNTLRLLQLPAGVQRALADGSISAGHARALLGTPDRALQEELAIRVSAEGLSVRALEEIIREAAGGEAREMSAQAAPVGIGQPVSQEAGIGTSHEIADEPTISESSGSQQQTQEQGLFESGHERQTTDAVVKPKETKIRPAGIVELESLLESLLNTSVRVDMGPRRGRIVIDFGSLEDLERIYLIMSEGKEKV